VTLPSVGNGLRKPRDETISRLREEDQVFNAAPPVRVRLIDEETSETGDELDEVCLPVRAGHFE